MARIHHHQTTELIPKLAPRVPLCPRVRHTPPPRRQRGGLQENGGILHGQVPTVGYRKMFPIFFITSPAPSTSRHTVCYSGVRSCHRPPCCFSISSSLPLCKLIKLFLETRCTDTVNTEVMFTVST